MNKFRYNLKKKQKKKYIAKHDPRKNFRDKKMYPAEEASAGSFATTKCSLRKILQKLLPQESVEEPFTLLPREFPEALFLRAEEGSSRRRTFVFNLQHHRSLMSSILRFLQPFTSFKQLRGG